MGQTLFTWGYRSHVPQHIRREDMQQQPYTRTYTLVSGPAPASASATRCLRAGRQRSVWSRAEPAADWPASSSHVPGSMASRYGPHTPGTGVGTRVGTMWQVEVPQMRAMGIASGPSTEHNHCNT